MICDPFSGLETLIYTKNLIGEPLTPWSILPPSWTTACPTFPLKETVFMLEIVLSRLECLNSMWLLFQPFFVEALTMRSRLDVSSKIPNWNEKAFHSCKVKSQTNVDHIKWACWIYRLAWPLIYYAFSLPIEFDVTTLSTLLCRSSDYALDE